MLGEHIVQKTGHHIRPTTFKKGLFDTPDIIDDVHPYSVGDQEFIPPMHHLEIIRSSDSSYPPYRKLMDSLGLSASVAEKSWSELSERSRRRKAGAFFAVTNKIAKFMAAEEPDALKRMAFRSEFEGEYERPRSDQFNLMMANVKESFDLADSRAERLAAISLISHLSLTEIQHFIPSLSEYFLTEARRFARRGFHLEDKEDIRVKYDAEKIDRFIEFITRYSTFTFTI